MLRIFRLTLAASLTLSTLLFIAWTIHWPLLGDTTIIHYIVFLIQHGFAPYRDIHEMSMPGSYLLEMAAMRLFGATALAWRIFDFTLLALAAAAFTVLCRRAGWLPALFAAALFALVHGRDGLSQGGQRDLTMAVLLVAATAALTLAIRHRNTAAMAAFGLLAGIALTIKPTIIPLALAQLLIAVYTLRRSEIPIAKPVAAATLATLIAPLIALAFLIQQHAVAAFWTTFRTLVPYYATLGHKPLGYLLLHSISPLLPLVLIWFAILALARPRLDGERTLLLSGVLFGLLSYILQARGWPYYRYPLLAFLLPLMALDFTETAAFVSAPKARSIAAWGEAPGSPPPVKLRAESPTQETPRKLAGALALIALATGGLFLAPQSALLIHRYRWQQDDFNATLTQSLNRLGGPALSGRIQCIDSISGCVATLYRMQLLPTSGTILDFPLFGADDQPAVQQARADFRSQIFAHPPQVIVLTAPLYPDGPADYKKLALWPELPTFLAQNYTLDTDWHPTRTQRWWSREEFPPSYRIFVRR